VKIVELIVIVDCLMWMLVSPMLHLVFEPIVIDKIVLIASIDFFVALHCTARVALNFPILDSCKVCIDLVLYCQDQNHIC
jgi:hypothetical protein